MTAKIMTYPDTRPGMLRAFWLTALAVAMLIAQAIAAQDRNAFKGIPGVGKKTVERILLDLDGKLVVHGNAPIARPIAKAPERPAPSGPAGEVVMLLVGMGYKRPEAERAVETLELEGKDLQTLLREVLAAL